MFPPREGYSIPRIIPVIKGGGQSAVPESAIR